MLNKSMAVVLTGTTVTAEEVFLHWVRLSEQGYTALVLSQVKIPNIFALKKKYRRRKNKRVSTRKLSQIAVESSNSEKETDDDLCIFLCESFFNNKSP